MIIHNWLAVIDAVGWTYAIITAVIVYTGLLAVFVPWLANIPQPKPRWRR